MGGGRPLGDRGILRGKREIVGMNWASDTFDVIALNGFYLGQIGEGDRCDCCLVEFGLNRIVFSSKVMSPGKQFCPDCFETAITPSLDWCDPCEGRDYEFGFAAWGIYPNTRSMADSDADYDLTKKQHHTGGIPMMDYRP